MMINQDFKQNSFEQNNCYQSVEQISQDSNQKDVGSLSYQQQQILLNQNIYNKSSQSFSNIYDQVNNSISISQRNDNFNSLNISGFQGQSWLSSHNQNNVNLDQRQDQPIQKKFLRTESKIMKEEQNNDLQKSSLVASNQNELKQVKENKQEHNSYINQDSSIVSEKQFISSGSRVKHDEQLDNNQLSLQKCQDTNQKTFMFGRRKVNNNGINGLNKNTTFEKLNSGSERQQYSQSQINTNQRLCQSESSNQQKQENNNQQFKRNFDKNVQQQGLENKYDGNLYKNSEFSNSSKKQFISGDKKTGLNEQINSESQTEDVKNQDLRASQNLRNSNQNYKNQIRPTQNELQHSSNIISHSHFNSQFLNSGSEKQQQYSQNQINHNQSDRNQQNFQKIQFNQRKEQQDNSNNNTNGKQQVLDNKYDGNQSKNLEFTQSSRDQKTGQNDEMNNRSQNEDHKNQNLTTKKNLSNSNQNYQNKISATNNSSQNSSNSISSSNNKPMFLNSGSEGQQQKSPQNQYYQNIYEDQQMFQNTQSEISKEKQDNSLNGSQIQILQKENLNQNEIQQVYQNFQGKNFSTNQDSSSNSQSQASINTSKSNSKIKVSSLNSGFLGQLMTSSEKQKNLNQCIHQPEESQYSQKTLSDKSNEESINREFNKNGLYQIQENYYEENLQTNRDSSQKEDEQIISLDSSTTSDECVDNDKLSQQNVQEKNIEILSNKEINIYSNQRQPNQNYNGSIRIKEVQSNFHSQVIINTNSNSLNVCYQKLSYNQNPTIKQEDNFNSQKTVYSNSKNKEQIQNSNSNSNSNDNSLRIYGYGSGSQIFFLPFNYQNQEIDSNSQKSSQNSNKWQSQSINSNQKNYSYEIGSLEQLSASQKYQNPPNKQQQEEHNINSSKNLYQKSSESKSQSSKNSNFRQQKGEPLAEVEEKLEENVITNQDSSEQSEQQVIFQGKVLEEVANYLKRNQINIQESSNEQIDKDNSLDQKQQPNKNFQKVESNMNSKISNFYNSEGKNSNSTKGQQNSGSLGQQQIWYPNQIDDNQPHNNSSKQNSSKNQSQKSEPKSFHSSQFYLLSKKGSNRDDDLKPPKNIFQGVEQQQGYQKFRQIYENHFFDINNILEKKQRELGDCISTGGESFIFQDMKNNENIIKIQFSSISQGKQSDKQVNDDQQSNNQQQNQQEIIQDDQYLHQEEVKERQENNQHQNQQLQILLLLKNDGKHFIKLVEFIPFNKDIQIIIFNKCVQDLENLLQTIKILEDKTFLKIIFDLIQGLKIMRELNILHLDIKTKNILLDQNGNFIFCDFGISEIYELGKLIKVRGYTEGFSAKEQMSNNNPCFKSDVFSLGKVFNRVIICYKEKSNPESKIQEFVNEVEKIVLKMIQDKVEDRADCDQIYSQLRLQIQTLINKQSKNESIFEDIFEEITTFEKNQKDKSQQILQRRLPVASQSPSHAVSKSLQELRLIDLFQNSQSKSERDILKSDQIFIYFTKMSSFIENLVNRLKFSSSIDAEKLQEYRQNIRNILNSNLQSQGSFTFLYQNFQKYYQKYLEQNGSKYEFFIKKGDLINYKNYEEYLIGYFEQQVEIILSTILCQYENKNLLINLDKIRLQKKQKLFLNSLEKYLEETIYISEDEDCEINQIPNINLRFIFSNIIFNQIEKSRDYYILNDEKKYKNSLQLQNFQEIFSKETLDLNDYIKDFLDYKTNFGCIQQDIYIQFSRTLLSKLKEKKAIKICQEVHEIFWNNEIIFQEILLLISIFDENLAQDLAENLVKQDVFIKKNKCLLETVTQYYLSKLKQLQQNVEIKHIEHFLKIFQQLNISQRFSIINECYHTYSKLNIKITVKELLNIFSEIDCEAIKTNLKKCKETQLNQLLIVTFFILDRNKVNFQKCFTFLRTEINIFLNSNQKNEYILNCAKSILLSFLTQLKEEIIKKNFNDILDEKNIKTCQHLKILKEAKLLPEDKFTQLLIDLGEQVFSEQYNIYELKLSKLKDLNQQQKQDPLKFILLSIFFRVIAKDISKIIKEEYHSNNFNCTQTKLDKQDLSQFLMELGQPNNKQDNQYIQKYLIKIILNEDPQFFNKSAQQIRPQFQFIKELFQKNQIDLQNDKLSEENYLYKLQKIDQLACPTKKNQFKAYIEGIDKIKLVFPLIFFYKKIHQLYSNRLTKQFSEENTLYQILQNKQYLLNYYQENVRKCWNELCKLYPYDNEAKKTKLLKAANEENIETFLIAKKSKRFLKDQCNQLEYFITEIIETQNKNIENLFQNKSKKNINIFELNQEDINNTQWIFNKGDQVCILYEILSQLDQQGIIENQQSSLIQDLLLREQLSIQFDESNYFEYKKDSNLLGKIYSVDIMKKTLKPDLKLTIKEKENFLRRCSRKEQLIFVREKLFLLHHLMKDMEIDKNEQYLENNLYEELKLNRIIVEDKYFKKTLNGFNVKHIFDLLVILETELMDYLVQNLDEEFKKELPEQDFRNFKSDFQSKILDKYNQINQNGFKLVLGRYIIRDLLSSKYSKSLIDDNIFNYINIFSDEQYSEPLLIDGEMFVDFDQIQIKHCHIYNLYQKLKSV